MIGPCAIELSGVMFAPPGRGDAPLFAELDLAVAAGDVMLLSGASSSGKTTLLAMMIGARAPDAGTVKVFDRDLSRLRRSSIALLRRQIGIVPQELGLIDDATALHNVALPLEIQSVARGELKTRAAEALAAVGLGALAGERADRLSTSQRRLVAFARALAGEPAIVLADEPTADLDSIRTDEVCALIEELRGRGTTCVITTNDPQLLGAAALCGWRHHELRHGSLYPADLDLAEPARAIEPLPDGAKVIPIGYAGAVQR